ncbi:4-oxalocrotonate tautomerase [bacterium]|nr:MAG: 4-oxalocrotonate tautomerase [bacterium]
MPIVNIDWLEGRTVEQKRKLAEEITDSFVKNTGCPPEAVTIIFTDHPGHEIAKAGKLLKG